MDEITAQQILDSTRIENLATLIRWHKTGIIPPPITRTHPSGRGRVGYWPDWVLQHIVRVLQLRAEGKTLAQIRDIFGTNWDYVGNQYAKRYEFSVVSREMDQVAARRNLRELISNLLFEFKNLTSKDIKGAVDLIVRDTIGHATDMMQQGINPVLIVTPDSVALTADFAVSVELANRRATTDAFFVVPVWHELSAYLKEIAALPSDPSVRPCSRVILKRDSKEAEAPVTVMGSWKFEISTAPRKKRRTPRKKG